MPNHYHLLIGINQAAEASASVSTAMMQLSVSYTKAVNRRYDRVGPLFQGPFRAVHVDRNEYLLHLSRYIHLNPVTAGLVQRPEAWEFSSYLDYIGLRDGTLPSPEIVLSQFPNRSAYQAFVMSYTESDQDVIAHLMLD